HAPLLGCERSRLLEDAVGDPDLADVVEYETVLDADVVRERGLDSAREIERIALHTVRVGARSDVLGLECLRERADRGTVGLLHELPLRPFELDDAAQVARVEEQLRVVAAVEWHLRQ